jgi:hypothetical protein
MQVCRRTVRRPANGVALLVRKKLYAPQPGPPCRIRDIGPVSDSHVSKLGGDPAPGSREQLRGQMLSTSANDRDRSCAGGGTRTLKLFRARAPKTRAVANFATPAVPGDRTVTGILEAVGGLS